MSKIQNRIIMGIIFLIVISAMLISGFLMYALGFLSSDKDKALNLLSQVPEKACHLSVVKYMGLDELGKSILEEGGDVSVGYNNLSNSNFDEFSQDSRKESLSYNVGAKLDLKNQKGRVDVEMENDHSTLSLQAYTSMRENKFAVAMPEIIKDKVFTMTSARSSEKAGSNHQEEFLSQLLDEEQKIRKIIREQGAILYNNFSFERIEKGYRITIPKEIMREVLSNLANFIQQEKVFVSTSEKVAGVEEETSLKRYSDILKKAQKEIQDVTMEVYGTDRNLTGLKLNIPVTADTTVKCNITFSEKTSISETNYKIVAVINNVEQDKLYVKRISTEDKNQCMDEISFVWKNDNALRNEKTLKAVINKNDNSINVSRYTRFKSVTETFSANGKLRNLEKGKSFSCVLDDVELQERDSANQNSLIKLSYSLSLTMGILEGEVLLPAGKEEKVHGDFRKVLSAKYGKNMEEEWKMLFGNFTSNR